MADKIVTASDVDVSERLREIADELESGGITQFEKTVTVNEDDAVQKEVSFTYTPIE